MDDYQVEALAIELSKIKDELRLANALRYIALQDYPKPTPKEMDLSIDRALKDIRDKYEK